MARAFLPAMSIAFCLLTVGCFEENADKTKPRPMVDAYDVPEPVEELEQDGGTIHDHMSGAGAPASDETDAALLDGDMSDLSTAAGHPAPAMRDMGDADQGREPVRSDMAVASPDMETALPDMASMDLDAGLSEPDMMTPESDMGVAESDLGPVMPDMSVALVDMEVPLEPFPN